MSKDITTQPSQPTRHHRRTPMRRLLLISGPFLFLAVAFMLSAGVVQIVERPANRPQPTLAQERAAAGRLTGQPVPRAEASALRTLQRRPLPAARLANSKYALDDTSPVTLAPGSNARIGSEHLGLALSPERLAPGAQPYPASSRYYGLR